MRDVREQIRSTFYMLEDTSMDSSNSFLKEVELRIQHLTSTFALYRLNQLQSVSSPSVSSLSLMHSSLHPTLSISSDGIDFPRPFLAIASFPSPTPSTARSSYYSGSDLEEGYIAAPMPERLDFTHSLSPLPGRSRPLFLHPVNICK